jgi:excisionase family DNA binding protein
MQCLSTTIETATSTTGLSRSSLYRLTAEGKIDTVKICGRRFIKAESLALSWIRLRDRS